MQQLLAGSAVVPGAIGTNAVEQLVGGLAPLVLGVETDGEFDTGVVVGRSGAPGSAPELWVRLSTGKPVPIDCPGITILRRL